MIANENILNQVKLNLKIEDKSLDDLIAKLNRRKPNDADIFMQSFEDEYWSLEDGIIKDLAYSYDKGAGFRCVTGETTSYAYTEDFSPESLHRTAMLASGFNVPSDSTKKLSSHKSYTSRHYGSLHPFAETSDAEKVDFLRSLDRLARQSSKMVEKVTVSISSRYEQVLITRFDGSIVADIRPLFKISLSVVCFDGIANCEGSSSVGGRVCFSDLCNVEIKDHLVTEAIKLAEHQLKAEAAPAGEMPVVLGPGLPGILLHEAVGHGLEGDFNRKQTSAFSNRIGQKVASEHCTVIDDGTIARKRGSVTIDDEGTPGQKTTLIENGVLVGYIHDRMSAMSMGLSSTGNGRRESYEYAPLPRMTNTFLKAGPHEHAEIIDNVKNGIYAVSFSGGQVDITSGKFVFSANEAYKIENGKISTPIKGATLIGDGPSILNQVSMVGNNFELDKGTGVCGKDGQSVVVGVGQPSLLIDKIIVGGTNSQ
ncbi:MAG: metalloprotease TldD [Pseudomonadota bacterium]|nr:metalloprotease TldD [Pseudomonadota bacterium]